MLQQTADTVDLRFGAEKMLDTKLDCRFVKGSDPGGLEAGPKQAIPVMRRLTGSQSRKGIHRRLETPQARAGNPARSPSR